MVLFRYTFAGLVTAYGQGNNNKFASIKAGPGTIYIEEGSDILAAPLRHLVIKGNTNDLIQKQTKARSVENSSDVSYDTLNVTGKTDLFSFFVFL